MKKTATFAFLSALLGGGSQPLQAADTLPLEALTLPPGFEISIWGRIPGARSLARGENGTIFIGTRSAEGSVYALRDNDGDGEADELHTLDEDLFMPNGIAVQGGALYVAEVNRILRFDDIESRLADPGEPVVVTDELPDMRHHGWKYLAFGPDGKLYFNIGAPCNRCDSRDPLFASITRMNADGTGIEPVALGVRNSVGFAWHPETGQLWFTDNNADWLGDDNPPGEMNILTEEGQHFGYPYCHAMNSPDPWYQRDGACDEYEPPTQELGPHVAALGMLFYQGDQFPEKYHGQAIVAEHGSWNRTERIGYRLTLVTTENGVGTGYEDFVTGWIGAPEERAWGRPVDVLELPNGEILVSDDRADVIYRIWYPGE